MLTHRQIDRLWEQQDFRRLFIGLAMGRAEFPAEVVSELSDHPVATAALAATRLSELNQLNTPIFARLISFVISQRGEDLMWGSTMLTALCLRALAGSCLLQNRDDEERLRESSAELARLQKDDGSFPAEPVRRLVGDPATTAFIVAVLGDEEPFSDLFEINDALQWLVCNAPSTLRTLVNVAGLRVGANSNSNSPGSSQKKLPQSKVA